MMLRELAVSTRRQLKPLPNRWLMTDLVRVFNRRSGPLCLLTIPSDLQRLLLAGRRAWCTNLRHIRHMVLLRVNAHLVCCIAAMWVLLGSYWLAKEVIACVGCIRTACLFTLRTTTTTVMMVKLSCVTICLERDLVRVGARLVVVHYTSWIGEA